MKPIGIVANLEKPQTLRVAQRLSRQLKRLRQIIIFEQTLAGALKYKEGFSLNEIGRRCRLLIVLGGDGTVLRVAREIYPYQPLLLPINLGKLGFLAALNPRDVGTMLPSVLRGKFSASTHSTLEVSVFHHGKGGSRLIALNDAVVARGTVSRVAKLELYIDGQFLNSYVCDGIIFSTPTGSTAYSLSAGGPIVVPEARVFSITPICPHTLSNRSVIVGGESVVEVRMGSQPKELFLGLDGQQMIRLSLQDRVRIKMSPYQVRMAVVPRGSFFELLRHKLRWTGSHIS